MARSRNGGKNGRERRGCGTSAGGQSWGMSQPGEGVAAVGRDCSPCSPPRSHFHCRRLQERPKSGGAGLLPSANAPTLRPPLSSLLLFGLHGYRRNDSLPTPGRLVALDFEQNVRAVPPASGSESAGCDEGVSRPPTSSLPFWRK